MELITYRKTLDVHKNGVQFTLRGFETADKMSRVIEISLMASGDTVDFPLERLVAVMYVTTPSAKEAVMHDCEIVDNKIVYNVLPIVEEGITTMKLKLIETGPEGARRVLATPKFEVEVVDSGIRDDGPGVDSTFEENYTGDKINPEFTALENFIAKAEVAYGKRLERIELDSQCIFKAWFADGTTYETTLLRDLFVRGDVKLATSYAVGGTGLRSDEDIDNAKYYSKVAESEALSAKNIMENSEDVLSQVRQHGVYTAFRVDFNTGEVEYVSPHYHFNIDKTTGELNAEEQTYTFIEEISRVVVEWLASKGIVLEDLKAISEEHTNKIEMLEAHKVNLQADISKLQSDLIGAYTYLDTERVTPIELGGTGAKTKEDAIKNLGIDKYQMPWNVDKDIRPICKADTGFFVEVADDYDINSQAPVVSSNLATNNKRIYMKNSGIIYLNFKLNVRIFRDDQGLAYKGVKYAYLGIYVNEVLVASYGVDFFEKHTEADVVNGTYDKTVMSFKNEELDKDWEKTLRLNVKKGDVVRLYISAFCDDSLHGQLRNGLTIGVSNINLYANGETPYTYDDIDDTFPMKNDKFESTLENLLVDTETPFE